MANFPFATIVAFYKGLAAGAKEAAVANHQLDWDHLLRSLWGQMTRLEKKAYAASARGVFVF